MLFIMHLACKSCKFTSTRLTTDLRQGCNPGIQLSSPPIWAVKCVCIPPFYRHDGLHCFCVYQIPPEGLGRCTLQNLQILDAVCGQTSIVDWQIQNSNLSVFAMHLRKTMRYLVDSQSLQLEVRMRKRIWWSSFCCVSMNYLKYWKGSSRGCRLSDSNPKQSWAGLITGLLLMSLAELSLRAFV